MRAVFLLRAAAESARCRCGIPGGAPQGRRLAAAAAVTAWTLPRPAVIERGRLMVAATSCARTARGWSVSAADPPRWGRGGVMPIRPVVGG
jgi:hypothetical protein